MKMVFDEHEDAKFAMAPMIDMVFLLLVFFMSATHLAQQQVLPMEIPIADAGVVPRERPDRWVVNIDVDKQLYSGNVPVTLEELTGLLEARLQQNPHESIYLRADGRVSHAEVRALMSAMAEVGVDNFIFGVYNPTE
jgi:biopolymer transport protein ExbD